VFTGDFDANGTDDLFWYGPGSTMDSTWFTNRSRGSYLTVGRKVSGSYVPGAGDFNGNGADDVVWFSPNSVAGDPVWFGAPRSRSYTSSTVHS
jgi:hypothetical protein